MQRILHARRAFARRHNSCPHPKLSARWCGWLTKSWKKIAVSMAWDWWEFAVVEFLLPNDWARSLRELRARKCRWGLWISRFTATICRHSDRSRWYRKKRLDLRLRTKILCWSMTFSSRDAQREPRSTRFFRMAGRG